MPPKKITSGVKGKSAKKLADKSKKEEKPQKKNQKGGIPSTDEPDTDSADDYLSERSDKETSEDDYTDEETDQPEGNYDEAEDEDSLGDGEKVDDEQEENEESETESEKSGGVKVDDECLYRFVSKKEDVEDVEVEDYFDDDAIDNEDKYVLPEKRQTKPILFNNERVRVLGDRARQLSLGAKPMLNNVAGMDPKETAKMELAEKTMPLFVIRTLPNGKIEKWRISELQQL
jgi:DNA-directed RNA polymerase subunit K/omega